MVSKETQQCLDCHSQYQPGLVHDWMESLHSKVKAAGSSDPTKNDTCYACHGSRVEVAGTRKLDSELGEVVLPKLSNWTTRFRRPTG